jgi:hypothetical protein
MASSSSRSIWPSSPVWWLLYAEVAAYLYPVFAVNPEPAAGLIAALCFFFAFPTGLIAYASKTNGGAQSA